MFTITLFTLISFSLTKNDFVALYQKIAAETKTFLDILFVDAYKFSSGTSDFFLFPYIWSFYKLKGMRRAKSFLSGHTVFSIMWVLHLNFSANAMARVYLLATLIIHFRSFYPFELTSFFFLSFF